MITILDKIYAYGHENILGTHNTTIELTKDKRLTKEGNCIIGINATKACVDLSNELKIAIKNGKKIKIKLKIDDLQDCFYGYGDKDLKLLDKDDIVFRTSNYLSDRTVLINCTKSSSDLKRNLLEKIKIPSKRLLIIFELEEINGK
ncbi:MAG: DUF371 domain-containing protein [Promethearchaeota archaeon]|nr:MAG: DUF371 domain-containing protein [Candidatus Lokiarchaeota archaeon]